MADESWLEVRQDPEPTPEEVLAAAEESRRKNEQFERAFSQTMGKALRQPWPTLQELCDAGEEDYAREIYNRE